MKRFIRSLVIAITVALLAGTAAAQSPPEFEASTMDYAQTTIAMPWFYDWSGNGSAMAVRIGPSNWSTPFCWHFEFEANATCSRPDRGFVMEVSRPRIYTSMTELYTYELTREKTGETITCGRGDGLTGCDETVFQIITSCPDSNDETFSGSVCMTNGGDEFLYVEYKSYASVTEEQLSHTFDGVAWIDGQEPVNYCPDGIEVVETPEDIPLGASWTSSITTTYDAMAVRYVLTRTDGIAPSYVNGVGSINTASAEFNEYSAPVTVTVPTTDYGVPGGVANLSVENTGDTSDDDFTLLSACVIEASPSPYCPDGQEALESPVDIAAGLDSWARNNIETPWDEIRG